MPTSSYIMRNKPVLFFYSSLLHYLWFYRPLSLAPLYHFSKPRSSLFSFLGFVKALLHLWSSLPLVSLPSLVFQDEVIRTTQNLQNTRAQRFIQWYKEVCIFFSTLPLDFLMFTLPFSSPLNISQCFQKTIHSVSSTSFMTDISTSNASLRTCK